MKAIELNDGRVTVVDDEDFADLAQYRWRWQRNETGNYAVYRQKYIPGSKRNGKAKNEIFFMAKVIMKCPEGKFVDHKNMDGLDNRKENLRIATHGQNKANSRVRRDSKSGIKGIRMTSNKTHPWRAHITSGKVKRYLGCFATKEEAHQAYCEAAVLEHGEFARLN